MLLLIIILYGFLFAVMFYSAFRFAYYMTKTTNKWNKIKYAVLAFGSLISIYAVSVIAG